MRKPSPHLCCSVSSQKFFKKWGGSRNKRGRGTPSLQPKKILRNLLTLRDLSPILWSCKTKSSRWFPRCAVNGIVGRSSSGWLAKIRLAWSGDGLKSNVCFRSITWLVVLDRRQSCITIFLASVAIAVVTSSITMV